MKQSVEDKADGKPVTPPLPPYLLSLVRGLLAVPIFLWIMTFFPSPQEKKNFLYQILFFLGPMLVTPEISRLLFAALEAPRKTASRIGTGKSAAFLPVYRFLGGMCAVFGGLSFLINRVTGQPSAAQVALFTIAAPLYYYLIVCLVRVLQRVTICTGDRTLTGSGRAAENVRDAESDVGAVSNPAPKEAQAVSVNRMR